MFRRIMAVVMSIMVALTAALSAVTLMTLRSREIGMRLDALKKEAREIAYLAAQDISPLMLGIPSAARSYLSRRASEINREYGAYILVVDRWGRVMDNLRATYQEDPDFVASLNSRELTDALTRVLGGEELAVRVNAGGRATFTVGVPFVQQGAVLGAVLIQTKAQQLEGGLNELWWRIGLMTAAAILAAAAALLLLVRHTMKPLRQLTAASRAMAGGDFSVRVSAQGSVPETDELARAFNTMADRLGDMEKNRREFVANVSHELRSPITSISGFVEGMVDGTIPPEEHGKYLAVVGDESKRLSKLIGDLLALSRLERDDAKLEMSDFDMCEMLRRSIIRRMGDLEGKQLEVVCDFSAEPCIVHADGDRIEQVVVNLLDNAIRFTPPGGRITLGTAQTGNTVTVTVSDNGIGVSKEARGRIFERFFTEDPAHTSGKGTGLGLSICQRIMEMHGQHISLLDSEEGAVFAFTLPAGRDK